MKSSGGIFIGIGSNMGNRKANIGLAVDHMQSRLGTIVRQSSLYVSPPWGFDADQDFYNAIVELDTALDPLSLIDGLKQIEQLMGREKKQRSGYESRLIDLDIIDYRGLVMVDERLTLPHPNLHLRAFVLAPLVEVCPEWKHPVSAEKALTMLQAPGLAETAVKLGATND